MTRHWQDIEPGELFRTGTIALDTDRILAFAREFDPQPYHLDSAAAERSIFGGLCASGWQVSALMMRLLTETLQREQIPVLGIASVPALQWRRPVFAGDELSAGFRVLERDRASRIEGCGSVDVEVTVDNQSRKPVLTLVARLLVPHGDDVRVD